MISSLSAYLSSISVSFWIYYLLLSESKSQHTLQKCTLFALTGHFFRNAITSPYTNTHFVFVHKKKFVLKKSWFLYGMDSTRCLKHSFKFLVHVDMIATTDTKEVGNMDSCCCRFIRPGNILWSSAAWMKWAWAPCSLRFSWVLRVGPNVIHHLL